MQIELSIPIVISLLALILSGLKYLDKSKERLFKLELSNELLENKIESLKNLHDEKLANLKEILDEIKEKL